MASTYNIDDQCLFYLLYLFIFLFQPHPWHMEVLGLGIKSESPLQAALQLWQHWIRNQLYQSGNSNICYILFYWSIVD